MDQYARTRTLPATWLLGLLLLAAGPGYGASLDIDGDGAVAAATDGQLVLRHLFGFRGAILTSGALAPGATRDAAAITAYLNGTGNLLDLDGNGQRDALTDGVLLVRWLAGRTGVALTQGAIGAGATRTDPDQVVAYLAAIDPAPAALRLNDTGITTCSHGGANGLTCPVTYYPGQDAEDGRDKTHNDDSDGHAGFSFTKLDGSGSVLAASAADWVCVRDNITGLIWEVKTDDGGLRDQDNTYSWYNPDASTNGGSLGGPNKGSCTGGINCDTDGYVQAVNSPGLCGVHDWRLPTSHELLSILTNDRFTLAIDTAYFPNTPANASVWSSATYAYDSIYAWYAEFGSGSVYMDRKNRGYLVRLVRAGQ